VDFHYKAIKKIISLQPEIQVYSLFVSFFEEMFGAISNLYSKQVKTESDYFARRAN